MDGARTEKRGRGNAWQRRAAPAYNRREVALALQARGGTQRELALQFFDDVLGLQGGSICRPPPSPRRRERRRRRTADPPQERAPPTRRRLSPPRDPAHAEVQAGPGEVQHDTTGPRSGQSTAELKARSATARAAAVSKLGAKAGRAAARLREADMLTGLVPDRDMLERSGRQEEVTRVFEEAAVGSTDPRTFAAIAAPALTWKWRALELGAPVLPWPGSERRFHEGIAIWAAELRLDSGAASAVSRPLRSVDKVCAANGLEDTRSGRGSHKATAIRGLASRERRTRTEGSKAVPPQVVANILDSDRWGRSTSKARELFANFIGLTTLVSGRPGESLYICPFLTRRNDAPPSPREASFDVWFYWRKFKPWLSEQACAIDKERPIFNGRRMFLRMREITGEVDFLLPHISIRRHGRTEADLSVDCSRRMTSEQMGKLFRMAMRDGGVPEGDLTVQPTFGGAASGKRFRNVRPHGLRKTVPTTQRGKLRKEDQDRRFHSDEALREHMGHKSASTTKGSYDEEARLDDLAACRGVFDDCTVSSLEAGPRLHGR